MNDTGNTTYEELPADRLRDLADQWNDQIGADPGDTGYIPTSQNKGDLVAALERRNALEDGERPGVEQRTEVVTGAQVKSHPLNPRPEFMCRRDRKLMTAIDENGRELTKPPLVVDSGEADGDEPVYYVLAGNRSYTLWRLVQEHHGDDPDDRELTVTIRETDGDEQFDVASQLEIMYRDNDSHEGLTIVEQARQIRALQRRAGISQTAAGERLGISRARASQIVRVLDLPDRAQELVMYEQKSEYLVENYTLDELDTMGVPYTTEGGDVVVVGIGTKNAHAIVKRVIRKSEKTRDDTLETIATAEMAIDVDDDRITGTILDAAQLLSTARFERWADNYAVRHDLVAPEDAPYANEPTSPGATETPDSSSEGGSDPNDEPEAPSDPGPDEPSNEGVVGITDVSGDPGATEAALEMSEDFEHGRMQLVDGAEKRLADLLWDTGTSAVAQTVVEWLREHEIVERVADDAPAAASGD